VPKKKKERKKEGARHGFILIPTEQSKYPPPNMTRHKKTEEKNSNSAKIRLSNTI
jgi:hypothetical protein